MNDASTKPGESPLDCGEIVWVDGGGRLVSWQCLEGNERGCEDWSEEELSSSLILLFLLL